MNGEAVDAWISSVDELLAGGRDDQMVSGDAMRWSPEVPEPNSGLAVIDLRALMADLYGPRTVDDYRIPHDLGRQMGLTVQQARTACQRMAEAVSEAVVRLGHAYIRMPLPDEPVEVDDTGNRIRRALDARRNRDTGPPWPPLGRRVR